MFYLSGVFYDISTRLSNTVICGFKVDRLMVRVNPVAYIIDDLRRVIIYGKAIRIDLFLYWLILSLLLLYIGLELMYKHENSYIKVV